MTLERTDAETNIKKEMKHFMALTVMSIAFGGIAMALAISSITVNGLALKTDDSTQVLNTISNIAVSFVVAGLGLWFLISTAEVMSRFDEIQEEKNEELKSSHEMLTTRIIQLIGLYREKKPQIKRMILVSKIAGICFFANALLQSVNLTLTYTTDILALSSAVGGILVSVVMGAIGFMLPSSFKKHAVCWDERILKSTEAEKKIASFLEEPL